MDNGRDLTTPKRYIRLKVMNTKKLDIGDIVKISNADDSILGKVVDYSEDFIILNNRNAVFLIRATNPADVWDYDILYSDFEK